MDAQSTPAELLAELLGLPRWMPRVILRTAFALIVLTFIVAPETIQDAFAIYAQHLAERVTDYLAPLLLDSANGTAP